MDGRKALEARIDLAKVPPVPIRRRVVLQPQPPSQVSERRRLPRSWAWFSGLVGPAVAAFCIAVEPAPADPGASEPLLASLLQIALLVSWGGAAASAWLRRPQALQWAGGIGGLSVILTVACPTSGHHSGIGAWWVGQLVVSGGALLLALWGRRRVTRGREV